MSEENANQDAAATQTEEFTLESALAKIEPEMVRDMIADKLNAAASLIRENNKRVLAVREAKNTDPNNTEYLDTVWARVIADETIDDKEMRTAEQRYQKAQAESEKQLKILRDAAKARHIQQPMSEEKLNETKKLINEGKATIATAKAAASGVAEMADGLLEKMAGIKVPGGIISLLPEAESLLNTRGRSKATTTSGEGYATRLLKSAIDGEDANRNVKKKGETVNAAHFNYIAEDLSKAFGASRFPENMVTTEQIEKAYYDSKGVTFRDALSMPETHEFEFTKDVKVQNPNDDSFKVEPVTKKISITRWTKEAADAFAAEQAKPAENADANGEQPANQ